MNKVFLIFLALMLTTSLVFAVGNGAQAGVNVPLATNSETQNEGVDDSLQNQVQVNAGSGNGVQTQAQIQIQTGNYSNQDGEQMQIQSGEEKGTTLRVRDIEAHSSMNITQEQVQNRTKLQVKLSNGLNAEVKIMPNTASETALAKLGAKCEINNCTMELREVGTGNQTRVAYEIKTQKQSKVLGLFRAQMEVQVQVDAENGEIIQTKKPWWAFLATE
jgi:hypothetical protein